MNTYWRLLGFAKPIEKYAIPYFFYTLFYSLFNTFNFVMIIPILNSLFDPAKQIAQVTSMPAFALNMDYFDRLVNFLLYKIYGPDYSVMNVMLFLSIFIVSSALLSNMFRYLGQWTIENMKIHTLRRLRNAVFDNVMGLHVGYFSNERKGDIISKITSDVTVVQFCITNTLQVAFREPFLIIGYMIALVKISWELTIFSAIFLPLTALLIGSIVKRLRKSAKQAQENFGDMTSLLDEALTGVKVVKGYNATGYITGKFRKINDIYSRITRSMARRQQLASPMSEFLGISAAAVLLLYGGSLVLDGRLEAAGFIAYLAIFTQITRPVRSFTDAFSNINQGIAAGDRVLGLLDEKSRIPEATGAVRLEQFRDSIEFRDVSFSYDDSRKVIDSVSFTIRKGETALLRRYLGCDLRGRDRPARIPAGQPAQPHGHRHAGDDPVQRHDRGQHPPRQARRDGRRSGSRRTGGQRGRFYPRDRARLRHERRRPGHEALRRAAPAPQHRARGAQKPRHPDPRRGHFGTRYRIGKARAGGPRFAAQGAHVAGNRAPPEHDRGRRQDHRDRARPHRRTGYAPRIDGARRHLRTPDRNAATRVKPSGAPEAGTNPSGANSNTDSLRFPATFLYL